MFFNGKTTRVRNTEMKWIMSISKYKFAALIKSLWLSSESIPSPGR